jgi:hypothetical protein
VGPAYVKLDQFGQLFLGEHYRRLYAQVEVMAMTAWPYINSKRILAANYSCNMGLSGPNHIAFRQRCQNSSLDPLPSLIIQYSLLHDVVSHILPTVFIALVK